MPKMKPAAITIRKYLSRAVNARDKQGKTALMSALFHREKKLERIQLLLRAGADAGVKDNRRYTASSGRTA